MLLTCYILLLNLIILKAIHFHLFIVCSAYFILYKNNQITVEKVLEISVRERKQRSENHTVFFKVYCLKKTYKTCTKHISITYFTSFYDFLYTEIKALAINYHFMCLNFNNCCWNCNSSNESMFK